MLSKIYRVCDRCGYKGNQNDFLCKGEVLFHCPRCPSMQTTIIQVEVMKDKGYYD